MLQRTGRLLAIPCSTEKNYKLWGAPGRPKIVMHTPTGMGRNYKHADIIVGRIHMKSDLTRVLAYLGKHVPHAQKSLWSPDTPVPQDRHLTKLTTLDIDAFKFWFGVKRAMISRDTWKLMWRAGLLPPSFSQHNPMLPRPVFEKQELMRYYLKNRKPFDVMRKEEYLATQNALIRSPREAQADRPKPPFL